MPRFNVNIFLLIHALTRPDQEEHSHLLQQIKKSSPICRSLTGRKAHRNDSTF